MIGDILKNIQPINKSLIDKAYERINNLTKPIGSLGRLEELAAKLFSINEGKMPKSFKKTVCVFAGDHGITNQGVSAYPKDVTYQMVYNFLNGGAAINVFARHSKADIFVIDVGVDYDFKDTEELIIKKVGRGTRDFSKEPAMTREEALRSIEVGLEVGDFVVERGYNLIATGDMGIGNTTASSAVMKAIIGADTKELVGRGTGLDERGMAHKIEIVDRAIALHKPDKNDAIDVLMKCGGFEIGAISGLILAAAYRKIPVVIDGFISSAGFLLAYTLNQDVKDYAFFAHRSQEKGHKIFFDYIEDKPIFDLDMRLGEGTGAALAFFIIEAAAKMFLEMATFEDANVSRKNS